MNYLYCSLEKRMISKNPSSIAPNCSARFYRSSKICLIEKYTQIFIEFFYRECS